MPSAFEHGPAITVPASNTTAKAAVIWSAASNLGESTIILDSGGNGRIGIAGDLDTITITSGTVTVAGTVAATTLTGAGAGITALNGTQITSGTLPAARIGADSIVEAKLNVSNAPTNGQVLTARSGVAGGFTWEAASAGATLSGSTNNTLVTVTGSNAMQGEAELTYYNGAFKIDYSGQTLLYIDSNTGASEVRFQNAGTDVWSLGMDTDGASNQKSHATDFAIYNGGTYGVVISGNGTTKFGIGTQAGIALSGAEIPDDGIQFPATQVANASANNLDDYEEGTTNLYIRDEQNDNAGHSIRDGRYCKIGRMVFIQCRAAADNFSNITAGTMYLGPLPFVSANVTNVQASFTVGLTSALNTTAGYSLHALVEHNSSTVVLLIDDTATGMSNITDTEFSADGQISISGCYLAAE